TAGLYNPLAEEGLRHVVPALGDGFELGDRLRERDVDDVVPAQRGHAPPLALLDEIGGDKAEPCCEHTVACSGRATALHVPEHGHPRLEAGAALDLAGERLADSAQTDMAELVERGLLRHLVLLA